MTPSESKPPRQPRALRAATTTAAADPVRTAFVDGPGESDEQFSDPESNRKGPRKSTVVVPVFEADQDGKFKEYMAAPALDEIVQRLTREDPHFEPLIKGGVRFSVWWRREGGKQAGVPKLCDAYPSTGLAKQLTDSHFVIWLAADHCQLADPSTENYEAMIFHCLCHCGLATEERSDDVRPKRIAHDFEGFHPELARYGVWRADLVPVRECLQQTTLPGVGNEPMTYQGKL